jgi:hypothetical protein
MKPVFNPSAGTAAAEPGHGLHKPIIRDICECARCGRGIGLETAELPIQADRPQERGSGDLIIGDVVAVAGVDVAQDEIGRTWAVNRGDDSKLQSSPTVPREMALVI